MPKKSDYPTTLSGCRGSIKALRDENNRLRAALAKADADAEKSRKEVGDMMKQLHQTAAQLNGEAVDARRARDVAENERRRLSDAICDLIWMASKYKGS